MKEIKTFGIVGLGKMGGNLALQALEKGYTVYGLDKNPLPDELANAGVSEAAGYENLANNLPAPRIIFVYVPAGAIVDAILDELLEYLEPGDIVVESGNSYWGDSIARAERLKKKHIFYIDCGTSGGVDGARNGACFMAGGEKEAIDKVKPIFEDLAVEGGFVHTGPPGTGHFVKLVHNGIEFGMLQAIGEGMALLEEFDYEFDMQKILHNWNHGSVIRSWLVELLEQQYASKGNLKSVPGYIEDTGEVNWLVEDAMKMEVPIPVIAQSVMQLFTSRDDKKNWAKAIAMMRNGFGGHPFGNNDYIRRERQISKVGNYVPFRSKREQEEVAG